MRSRPRRLVDTLQVVRRAGVAALADLSAIYTLRSWLVGWLLRVIAQVSFFGLVGAFVGGADTAAYLVIGHAVVIAAVEALLVIVSTAWERRDGTLPLLVASPGSVLAVFIGRGLQWIPTGVASASVSLLAAVLIFDVPIAWPAALLAPALIAALSVSSYCMGLALAAVVVRVPDLRNLASGAAYLSLMAVTGVTVPLAYWPAAVQAVATVLPVTHALQALRALLETGDPTLVARGMLLELAVGTLWLVVAAVFFRRLVESGRRNGTIEFSV